MKKLFIILALAWCVPAHAQIKSAKLTASGLTCSMCSKAIFKALEKVPFVEHVDADIENSSYTITFKNGQKVILDELKKAVVGAGFSVASMQVTATFDHVDICNDAHISLWGSTFHFLNVPVQSLDGEKTFTIVDKNYLPQSERKKYRRYTKMACFETGVMENCCPKKESASNRIYHVTI